MSVFWFDMHFVTDAKKHCKKQNDPLKGYAVLWQGLGNRSWWWRWILNSRSCVIINHRTESLVYQNSELYSNDVDYSNLVTIFLFNPFCWTSSTILLPITWFPVEERWGNIWRISIEHSAFTRPYYYLLVYTNIQNFANFVFTRFLCSRSSTSLENRLDSLWTNWNREPITLCWFVEPTPEAGEVQHNYLWQPTTSYRTESVSTW